MKPFKPDSFEPDVSSRSIADAKARLRQIEQSAEYRRKVAENKYFLQKEAATRAKASRVARTRAKNDSAFDSLLERCSKV